MGIFTENYSKEEQEQLNKMVELQKEKDLRLLEEFNAIKNNKYYIEEITNYKNIIQKYINMLLDVSKNKKDLSAELDIEIRNSLKKEIYGKNN